MAHNRLPILVYDYIHVYESNTLIFSKDIKLEIEIEKGS